MTKTKKTAPKTTRKTKSAKLSAASKRLGEFVSLISTDDPANAIHAQALKLLKGIKASPDFEFVPISAEEYVRAVYPNTTVGGSDPDTCVAAGLLIGAAAAWVLMQGREVTR